MTEQSPADVSVINLFRNKVGHYLCLNSRSVLQKRLSRSRSVEVLHLIDANPQPQREIHYHHVYRTLDTHTNITSHGIYIADPWPRHPGTGEESRHYFEGSSEV